MPCARRQFIAAVGGKEIKAESTMYKLIQAFSCAVAGLVVMYLSYLAMCILNDKRHFAGSEAAIHWLLCLGVPLAAGIFTERKSRKLLRAHSPMFTYLMGAVFVTFLIVVAILVLSGEASITGWRSMGRDNGRFQGARKGAHVRAGNSTLRYGTPENGYAENSQEV